MRFSDTDTIINARAYSPPASDTFTLVAPAGDPSAAPHAPAPHVMKPWHWAAIIGIGAYFLYFRK
jgi:hypothetical protein